MFKLRKFKKEAQVERMKIFEKMKNEQDIKKWKELKEQYDAYEHMEKPCGHVSASDVFAVAGSFASILLVLHYEKFDCITSKCFTWLKPKKL